MEESLSAGSVMMVVPDVPPVSALEGPTGSSLVSVGLSLPASERPALKVLDSARPDRTARGLLVAVSDFATVADEAAWRVCPPEVSASAQAVGAALAITTPMPNAAARAPIRPM